MSVGPRARVPRRRDGVPVLPVEVTRVPSFQPCESCRLRRSDFRVRLDPPGRARVTLRLCDTCIEALRL